MTIPAEINDINAGQGITKRTDCSKAFGLFFAFYQLPINILHILQNLHVFGCYYVKLHYKGHMCPLISLKISKIYKLDVTF